MSKCTTIHPSAFANKSDFFPHTVIHTHKSSKIFPQYPVLGLICFLTPFPRTTRSCIWECKGVLTTLPDAAKAAARPRVSAHAKTIDFN